MRWFGVLNPILVTGAAGFVGARFVESCNERGREVISVDEVAHFSSREEHRGLDFVTVVDRPELLTFLDSAPRLQAIVHLGAVTSTTEMDREVLREKNVECSQALWKFAVAKKIPFVYASSAATYGDGSLGFSDEESEIARLKPLNPYGESKQQFDLWALAQTISPPAWAGFKFFNVYGFGERHKGSMSSVVLQAFDQIQKSGRVKLFKSANPNYADGEQIRDFVSAEDVVKVLWFALEKPLRRGIYNLGTGKARTFHDLVKATFAALGKAPAVDFVEMPEVLKERYQYFTEAPMEKLRAAGYSEPFLSLEEGVARYCRRLEIAKVGGVNHSLGSGGT